MVAVTGPVLALGIDATAATRGAQQFQAATQQISTAGARASTAVTAVDNQFKRVQSTLPNLINYLKATAAAFGAFAALNLVRQLTTVTDAYSQLDARLKLVLGSTEAVTKAHQDLLVSSNATGSSFQATATLFTRVAQNSEELGLSYDQLLELTDLLNKSIVVSGASAEEASAGLFQLSQALAAGTLQGDEFRSIMENFPYLARTIASALDIPVGSLRALSSEGKITSDVIVKSVLSQRDTINNSYKEMGTTVGRETQTMENAWNELLVSFNETSEASSSVITAIRNITDFINSAEARGAVNSFAEVISGLVNVFTQLYEWGQYVADAINAVNQAARETASDINKFFGGSGAPGTSGATGSWGGEDPRTGSWGDLQIEINTPKSPKPVLGSGTYGGRSSKSAANKASRDAAAALRDEKQALDAVAQARLDVVNAQIEYLRGSNQNYKAYELEVQQLDLLHEGELRRLEDIKLSADQKSKILDDLTIKYEQLKRTLDLGYGNTLINDAKLPTDYSKATSDTVLFSRYGGLDKTTTGSVGDVNATSDDSYSVNLERYLELLNENYDATEALAEGTRSFIGDMSDGFVEAVIAGDSLLDMFSNLTGAIIQATIKAVILNSVMQSLGNISGEGGGGGGGLFGSIGGLFGSGAASGGFELGSFGTAPIVAHRGGMVGGPGFSRRGVSTSAFLGAPHFATGGIAGYEVPAILHKGEGVFTPGQMAAMGKSNVVVNVINNTDSRISTSRQETDDGVSINVIIDKVEQVLASRAGRTGTPLNTAIKNVGSVNVR